MFFFLISASKVCAQGSKVGGSIEGTVTDSSDAVISKLAIALRNTLTSQARTVMTNDQGFFRAEELPAGTYEVRIAHSGFESYMHQGVTVSLGETVRLDIVLRPASASAGITVSAQPPAIDTSQTAVVSSVDQERIEELPVHSRNYLDFVLLAPGVSSSPGASGATGSTPLAGSGFSFGGLRARSNNISIDGLDNNDEFTGSSRTELSPEIVQEFQVVNNGLSAESGGASGGSINVITRSGSNTIHGDAFIFAQDGALNTRDPFDTEPGKAASRRFRGGFALGGPIVKDKTFYYLAAEQEENRGQIGSDINPSVAASINGLLGAGTFPGLPARQITTAFSPTSRQETEAAGKLDQQLTKNTSLMLRYAFTKANESGDAFNTDGLADAGARGNSFITDNALSGSLTSVFGSEAVGALRFQAATRSATLRTNETQGPEIDIAGLVTFGRPYGGNSDRRENHYQADYTYARTRNNHLWKVGATVNRVTLRAGVQDGFGGVYLFGSLADFAAGRPDQFRQAFGNPNMDFAVMSMGAFVQDHWSVTRHLTVDLGARYDYEHLPAGFSQDINNVSPRLGAAWNPFPKLVLRAGYGIFFDREVLANLARAIDKNGSQAFEQVADGSAAAALFSAAGGGSLAAPVPGIAPSIFRADPRLATPYSEQISVGGEYLLAKNLTVRADYLFVRGVHLPRTVNVNLLPPVVLTLANAASLDVPNPTPQEIGRPVFSPARFNPQFNDIYQLQNSGHSTYQGVSFTVTRKMNEDLEFSGSYTVSRATDDSSDYDEQPQDPFNLRAENSISRQNQEQRLVFNALWELPIGDEKDEKAKGGQQGWLTRTFAHIEFATILTAQSGHPVNPLTGLDSNRSHAFPLAARPLTLGRNALRIPAFFDTDLRVVKYFPFGGVRRLDLVTECFNLFNRANVAQINPVFGPNLTPIAGFGQATEGVGVRQIQFSLDFEF